MTQIMNKMNPFNKKILKMEKNQNKKQNKK